MVEGTRYSTPKLARPKSQYHRYGSTATGWCECYSLRKFIFVWIIMHMVKGTEGSKIQYQILPNLTF